MKPSELLIAPINRSYVLTEILAGVPPGTYRRYLESISQIHAGDYGTLGERDLEVAIRERFNEMRSIRELRLIHDFANNWFGAPTRATKGLLWTWGHQGSPTVGTGEEFEPERCEQLLYTQEIALPAGTTLFHIGGFEWGPRAALAIGESTGMSKIVNHRS